MSINTDNTTSNSVLTSLNAGSKSSSSTTETGTSALGKDSFLQLLVTQLNNQNPLDPQDNTEFVSQLAQFSSLESMQNLDTTLGTFYSSFQSSQALQASSLVGRSVIVNSSKVQVDDPSAGVNGTLVMPSGGDGVTLKIYDDSGDLVRTVDMGSQKAGNIDFKWDGKDDSGELVGAGTYTVKATASLDGTSTALTTYLPATVNSVTLGQNGGEMSLNLAGIGAVSASSIQTIGK
ncbi:flagellar hook assembly protein FlgD [Pseudomonas nicosulfuronedens]|uniref:Basal-body rod modification protein FlgD n=1 Tax=Pseudomonas nicosulfuronedens TaxID=2571105 RepID=A0A5R9RBG4_9PSED|nr:flagellar hook assembly protein FlgD [Pseudomonas nicosulfuronedens]MDH1010628.1 flagellar hook assembly protein FlgD [Pseudomonas nicosulfuronedens]MDH1979722.1 flagellar hook assembly protein FlgD [Pseudomonas nicosulfuronedens]MDH2028157.1 flagellar hook assembly protein FlgD [Pseudomonas nicosulfuronedens]TLX80226.1 flagellar hook assembly protein FlgD [Pseudomonas nicosulfuronedens]